MYGGGTKDPKRKSVHKVLVHSYFATFIFFLLGVYLDIMWSKEIFDSRIIMPIGYLLLVAGTILIFWAQHSSHHFSKENVTCESFCRGPYRYTRNPTYWGLYVLLLGFGMVINAFFVIVLTLVSYFLTRFVFLRKEEEILAEKYGEAYLEYKKSVHV